MNWSTVSNLATGGGTAVLALATFGSIRSANRSARTAERALLAGQRPLLLHGRDNSPSEPVRWKDHFASVDGDNFTIDLANNQIYLACLVRNVGSGIAVLQGWSPVSSVPEPHADPDDFRILERDIYIAPGDTGFWQGAIRDEEDRHRSQVCDVIHAKESFGVDMLYSDPDGGQRVISRFRVVHEPTEANGMGGWVTAVVKHWNIDRADPRDLGAH